MNPKSFDAIVDGFQLIDRETQRGFIGIVQTHREAEHLAIPQRNEEPVPNLPRALQEFGCWG